MANDENEDLSNELNPELDTLDPAKRTQEAISALISEDEESDEIAVVNEKLQEKIKERKAEIEREEQKRKAEAAVLVESEAELAAAPVVEVASNRDAARVLVLTRDVSHLAAERPIGRIEEMANAFAEVHVIVLTVRKAQKTKARRLAQNAWVYATDSRYLRRTVADAVRVAKQELVFGEGFRPDIVIAFDPFESGLAALKIAKKFGRQHQVHLSDDFFSDSFKNAREGNAWRLRVAKKVLKNTSCMRTRSEYLKNRVEESYEHLRGSVEILPYFYNVQKWNQADTKTTASNKYPKFNFLMLHVTTMTERSHTDRAINGVGRILHRYPSIGLIVLGDGPERAMLTKHVEQLGLKEHVMFETDVSNIGMYMNIAHVLVYTSENTEDERTLFQAASSDLPIVCGLYGIASEIFVDGESALFCPLDNLPCFGKQVNKLLNDVTLRNKITANAHEIVVEQIEQDYGTFLESYRSSIERCLVEES